MSGSGDCMLFLLHTHPIETRIRFTCAYMHMRSQVFFANVPPTLAEADVELLFAPDGRVVHAHLFRAYQVRTLARATAVLW